MNKYKVWIFLEEIDEQNGHDRTLCSIGKEFVTLEEAKILQQRLKELIRTGDTEDYKNLLLDLLADLHGDGGHYAQKHGVKKAVKDALRKFYSLSAKSCVTAANNLWDSVTDMLTEEQIQRLEQLHKDDLRKLMGGK